MTKIERYDKKKIAKITKEITNEKDESNEAYTKIDRTIETINLSIKELKEKQEKIKIDEYLLNLLQR